MKAFWFAMFPLVAPLCLAQTRVTAPPKTISSMRDIEKGMSADLVIAGLTKAGYSLKNSFAGLPKIPDGSANWKSVNPRKFLAPGNSCEPRFTAEEC
jgi:hypothetical protein